VVTAGSGPRHWHGVDSEGQRVGGLLVVSSPANEIRPCLGGVATGADCGDSAKNSAAESSTASREITHDVADCDERNRTSGKYALWLSPTSMAQRSHCAYRSGSVPTVSAPGPSKYGKRDYR
jgi:hypothetical protein